MQKLHLDTDIGGDIDDLCALALALNWPDVELLAITTVAEHGGKRAGCAVALGWNDEVKIKELPLSWEMREGWLSQKVDAAGKLTPVVTRVNGNKFNQFWLDVVAGSN